MKLTMKILFSAVIVFWNVENCFDYRSGNWDRSWTGTRFEAKINGISKVILSLSDSGATPPPLVALAEIENEYVLRRLCFHSPLRKYGYRYIHFDSPDRRGIDCALLYRDMVPRACAGVPIMDGADTVPTRLLLVADFDSLRVITAHLPSKRGNSPIATKRRLLALQTINAIVDTSSLPVVVVGDFNDVRTAVSDSVLRSLREVEDTLFPGTIKFDGNWERIDRCLVRGIDSCRAETVAQQRLLCEDKKYGGVKPLRTYSGPRYLGGISDHLPIRVFLRRQR